MPRCREHARSGWARRERARARPRCRALAWCWDKPGPVVERAPPVNRIRRIHGSDKRNIMRRNETHKPTPRPRPLIQGLVAMVWMRARTRTPRDPVEESRRRRAVAVLAMTRVVVLVLVVVRRKVKVGFKINGEPLKEGAGREHTT
ncbi:hypothetical protein B0H17DRAFT_1188426 [Mycena rosella]|uniref:Uncharacterized protein n=1 Tax=Mycena rosella TaxID=1033263 RepID=A0AAD7BHX4_MYCRO|nr:hypothetical protein B0H17DRAFT_1188426 [Mycena rosella]